MDKLRMESPDLTAQNIDRMVMWSMMWWIATRLYLIE